VVDDDRCLYLAAIIGVTQRVVAEWTYGVPPEQLVGRSGKLKFEMRDGTPIDQVAKLERWRREAGISPRPHYAPEPVGDVMSKQTNKIDTLTINPHAKRITEQELRQGVSNFYSTKTLIVSSACEF
jgi:hypothetical protein